MQKKITTIVCLHDLLGYGDMIAVSGGTLDSAVGEIAYQRINTLRKTLGEVKDSFPSGTTFFQLNDSAVAVCDLDIDVGSMHVSPESISCGEISPKSAFKLLNFVCGSANLHQKTIHYDHHEKVGPAGRTFIVLGERWSAEEYNDGILGVPELQTNLAFAEAYLADLQGSRAGFNNRTWENIYINDLAWFCIVAVSTSICREVGILSARIFPGSGKPFPYNIFYDEKEVTIFKRKRKFYSVRSHHAIDINKVLDGVRESKIT